MLLHVHTVLGMSQPFLHQDSEKKSSCKMSTPKTCLGNKSWAGHGGIVRSPAFGLMAAESRPQGLACQLAAAAHQRTFSPQNIQFLDASGTATLLTLVDSAASCIS